MRVEKRAESPGTGYVYTNGYHRWDGDKYQWTPGEWKQPPNERSKWVDHRWDHREQHRARYRTGRDHPVPLHIFQRVVDFERSRALRKRAMQQFRGALQRGHPGAGAAHRARSPGGSG